MLANPDDVLDALPLPSKLGAGQQATGIAPACSFGLELIGQRVELAPGTVGEAAEAQFLNPEGEPVLQVAPAENRCLLVEQRSPHLAQLGGRLAFQGRDLCQDRVAHRPTCLRCRAVA